MIVIKSRGMWREDFEKKNLKYKDIIWMRVESIEFIMSLSRNGGKDLF